MMLVLDASMVLSWIFERADAAERDLADRALQALSGASASVPALWHVEVANALLVGERRRVITPVQGADFLRRLDRLSIRVDVAETAAHRDAIMALARLYDLTAYDACYLELALRSSGALASFDAKLIKAAGAAGIAVFQ
ncbi:MULTISPECIES: type II toxin-antitoxin system VapC family toxin [Duganella]|uniref:type II toxin-antitoxin system VapC family toxin n=1 Tax=Duganella TaxID=75654 RepID=UPI0030EAF4CB